MSSIYCRNNTGVWMVAYKDSNGKRHDKSFGRGPDGEAAAMKFYEDLQENVSKHVIPDLSPAPKPVDVEIANEPVQAVLAQPIQNQMVQYQGNPNKLGLSGITFRDLMIEYIEHTESNGSGRHHINSMKTVGRGVLIPFFGADTDIAAIDYSKHIVPFLKKIKSEPSRTGGTRSNITINQYGHYIAAMYNYAILRGYVMVSPMRFWKPLKKIRIARQVTFEDACKIMYCAQRHIRWCIQLVCYLGVRPGPCELLSLKWSDVDFEKQQVHVYASKTNTHRYVNFNDDFAVLLKSHKRMSTCEYVVEYEGKQMKNLRTGFKHACERAGITYPVRMYDFRHLFATMMLNKGADLAAVSKLMGHAKITTTANVYYETRSSEMKRAVSLLPQLPEMIGNDDTAD